MVANAAEGAGPSLVAWWRQLPPLGQDVLLAAAFVVGWAAVTLTGVVLLGFIPDFPSGHWTAMWASALVIALRRSAPPWLLLAGVPLYPVIYAVPMETEFHLLPVLIAGYVVASSGEVHPVAVGVICVAGAALLSLSLIEENDRYVSGSRFLFGLFVVAGTVFLGALVLAHRRNAAVLAERNAELERLRAVEARQVVADERSRIARELHDVVAHHMSAVVIRAQAADRLAATRPEVATEAVGWIADTGREALSAMRRTVRVLRTADGSAKVELAPQATLADIPAIAARLREAGLEVEVELPDPLPVVDAFVDLAAVRIAQEALTNALRHADARRARVAVREVEGVLIVDVEDDGVAGGAGPVGPPPEPEGHGLRGMAERAASCGGELEFGRSTLGGWRVTARLPLDVRSPTP